jgi:hypothetical protein
MVRLFGCFQGTADHDPDLGGMASDSGPSSMVSKPGNQPRDPLGGA